MCTSCIELIETVLCNRPMPMTRRKDWDPDSEWRLGQPLNQAQKVVWVKTWLPMTAAVMDLSGAIRAAEREPAHPA